jgi:hypothetical protein
MINTKDNWLITATIHDEERRELWSEVFPGGVVPIEKPITQRVNVPGHDGVNAYMLDLGALTDPQLDAVAQVIAKQFGYPFDEVRREIYLGVPVLAEGVTVLVRGNAWGGPREEI